MAGVATGCVVDVIPHAGMVWIRVRLAMIVTGDTREHCVIRWIRVAISASCPPPSVRPRIDWKPRVVERRAQPTRGCVARLARCREHCRNVVRIGRRLILRFVAAIAIGWSPRILTIDVATCARDIHVRAREREPRVVVIESGRLPGRRAVTDRAVEGEPGSLVVRIGRRVVIVEVTTRASRTQTVVSVYVTSCARESRMCAGQREPRLAVVEYGPCP